MKFRDVEVQNVLQFIVVSVAQLVEPRIVIPVVAGSSPVGRPTDLCTFSGFIRIPFF